MTAEPAAPKADTPARAQSLLVLDLCTGSGIIPVCLARETGARVIGVDISPEALEFARKNVEAHGLAGQIGLVLGDLTAPVPARFHGRFDLLTANPPYIPPTDMEGLEPEVTKFEPRQALVGGGTDGTEVYRRIAREVHRMVRPGGWVLLEVGTTLQAGAVRDILAEQRLESLEILKDLSGRARVVKARRPVSA